MSEQRFGDLIRTRRRQLGLSQTELAGQLGIIDHMTLSKIENDHYWSGGSFDPMLVTAIAFALQIDEDVAFNAARYSAENPKAFSLEGAMFPVYMDRMK